MGNNGDFYRKNLSLLDVGEFYSDNLVIFTENSDEQWDRINASNPLLCEVLTMVFGEHAKYMVTEIKADVTDKDIVNIVNNHNRASPKSRDLVLTRSRLNLD